MMCEIVMKGYSKNEGDSKRRERRRHADRLKLKQTRLELEREKVEQRDKWQKQKVTASQLLKT